MDYSILAGELLEHLRENSKQKIQKDTEGFSHGEMSILAHLHFKENGVFPGTLCATLGMTTPRVSAAISSLENKGLISKLSDPADRRKIHIFITEEGVLLVRKKYEELTGNLTRLLESLGENDAKEYVRIMKKISEGITAEQLS